MPKISETDLIVNADGSVYHLHLLPHQIADTIIVVGDPDRVPMVSKYFDSIDYQIHKREFVTHTGKINNKNISVISSGIGTDNVDIVINELYALANINLATREVNKTHKALNIIRIGTSGSIQADVEVDSFLISEAAIGIDGLNDFYNFKQNNLESEICNALQNELQINSLPYFANGSIALVELFKNHLPIKTVSGATITLPGFYAPQGRTINYEVKNKDLLLQISNFNYNSFRLTNMEMETAGWYQLGAIMGFNCVSINAILANRIINQFSQKPDIQIDTLIKACLNVISEKLD
jgi:uridine phosphorylase